MNKLSIVVPCYEEEDSLPWFHLKVTKVLEGIKGIDYEIIFVDDGSKDRSLHTIKKLAEEDSHVRYVSFSRNFGKEAGMYAGLKEATGDYCVIMDADLQHPPALLPEMYCAVTEEGYDCCGGMRKGREGDGTVRSFLSRTFYKVGQKMTHLEMDDGKGDFRMMSRRMVEAILDMKEYHRYMKGLYSFVGFETKWIEYENIQRENGVTKWSLKNLFVYAMEGILSFSTAPLKAAGVFGLIVLIGGVICMLSRQSVILCAVMLFSGMQMIFLYIIGVYLSKDYLENKKRPMYIIKERG
ncbi:MAG: glycosyltransferase family 2 protein [Firmicutes bacterium]|nr:glycosyltransferase family 2 protein [Bacillota bacterium]